MLKTVSSFVNVIGALNYKGTWNATTNNPTLASGVGTKGDYYVVNVAGSTTIDGESLWGVGDWIVFNGTTWQKVDGGDTGNFTSIVMAGSSTGITTITSANAGASNYTVSIPAANTTIPVASQTLTFTGPSAARTITLPDANFTAARTDAANSFTGDQTLATGNIIQGTAAKGINFTANTPAAGNTSRLLNWYEEGTWTPQYTFDTPPTTPITMNTTSATYTRIGRQVTVRAFVATSSVDLTGASGALYISGLPFSMASNGYAPVSVTYARNWAGNYPSAGYVGGSSLTMEYRAAANGATALNTTTDLSTSAGSNQNQLIFACTYFV